jgi:hypothetical protein
MDRTYSALVGQPISETIQKALGNTIVLQNAPNWVTIKNNKANAVLSFNSPIAGVFVIPYGEYNGLTPIYTGVITITIVSQFEDYDNCCENPTNIAWLSPLGWVSYIFIGKRTFQVDIGSNKTFRDRFNTLKYSERTGVRNAVTVTSGYIPKHHIDYIAPLRYAVQVFLYNDITGNWDIPIVINPDSFVNYKDGQKLFEVSFDFVYANEKLIQTQ